MGIYNMKKAAMDILFELDKDSADVLNLLTQRVEAYEKLREICRKVLSSK
jgi:hypothetical protein